MKQHLIPLALFLTAIVTLPAALLAQQSQPLTNNDVLRLLRSGLSQDVVLEIVQAVPGHYDVQEQSLAGLKKKGASDQLISAIRQKAHAMTQPPPNPSSSLLREFQRTAPAAISEGALSKPEGVLAFNSRASSMEPESCADQEFSTTEDCHTAHQTGCSQSETPKYDAYLNFLKNRTQINEEANPISFAEIDADESGLPETLTTRNHAQHAAELASVGEGTVATLVGTLYYSEATGSETCNCQMSGSEDVVDFHIGIGADAFPLSDDILRQLRSGRFRSDRALNALLTATQKHTLQKDTVIVEMTPHYRVRNSQNNWSLDRLLRSTGNKVRVTGQLMVDNAHHISGQDCGLGETSSCWRRSIWEIHPVTRFEVCQDGSCTASSGPWIDLGQVQ